MHVRKYIDPNIGIALKPLACSQLPLKDFDFGKYALMQAAGRVGTKAPGGTLHLLIWEKHIQNENCTSGYGGNSRIPTEFHWSFCYWSICQHWLLRRGSTWLLPPECQCQWQLAKLLRKSSCRIESKPILYKSSMSRNKSYNRGSLRRMSSNGSERFFWGKGAWCHLFEQWYEIPEQ